MGAKSVLAYIYNPYAVRDVVAAPPVPAAPTRKELRTNARWVARAGTVRLGAVVTSCVRCGVPCASAVSDNGSAQPDGHASAVGGDHGRGRLPVLPLRPMPVSGAESICDVDPTAVRQWLTETLARQNDASARGVGGGSGIGRVSASGSFSGSGSSNVDGGRQLASITVPPPSSTSWPRDLFEKNWFRFSL